MKRLSLNLKGHIFVLALLLLLSVFSPAMAQEIPKDTAPPPPDEGSFETIRLFAAGRRFELKALKSSDGALFIPLNDVETGRIMNHFNCRTTYLAPMNTIVLGFSGAKDSRIVLGSGKGSFNGKDRNMKRAPFLLNGEPMIPLEALEYAWQVRTGYSEVTKSYYMDPVITSVTVEEIKGRPLLSVKATGPINYETSLLKDPLRYAIDINGAVLEEGLENKDLFNKKVGSLFLSHQSRNPNIVRIIIPLDKGIELEINENPQDRYSIEAWLYSPQVVAPAQDLKQERVTDLKVTKKENSVVFTVKTTGPVQYEWRRLLPPDNRYFVDIPNTLYTAPEFSQAFDVGYLANVRVVQHKPLPEPVVRVIFDLHVPSRISVAPDPKYPREIQIEVFSDTINPRRAQRQGFGITQHTEARGIVICLDPGHGGGDPGAVNRSMGLVEKEITLDISLRLARLLRKSGFNVVMTRTTDRDVSYAGSSDARELGDRVNIANQMKAQLFVSIHIDANYSSSVSGCTTYYVKDDSAEMAGHIQNNLVRANGIRDIGTRRQSFFVINRTAMPAVLVECAFISNPSDASLLSTPDFRHKCAIGIFNGIVSYAKAKNMAGVGPVETPDSSEEAELINKKKAEIEKKINTSEPVGSDSYSER